MATHQGRIALTAAALCLVLQAQTVPPAWDAVPGFKYNIVNVAYNSGTRQVSVAFNVTNPLTPAAMPYDIFDRSTPTFTPPTATLRVLVGWNASAGATELANTGSGPAGPAMPGVPRGWMNATPPHNPGGTAPAGASSINALTGARPCSLTGSPCGAVAFPLRTYWVTATLPPQAKGLGRVALEGHPVKAAGVDPAGTPLFANIPVTNVIADFAIDATAAPRRKVVEFSKCQRCHDGRTHDGAVVPRLSLHGANRNEELGVCVMCHNPDQTDAAYRSAGAEESVDFKRLVHGIHGNKKRMTPLVVVAFRGTLVDFGHVRFPGEVRNCLTCHVEAGGKGTYEVPPNTALGSTINTGSIVSPLPGLVDVNPANNLRISPIASACSGCHNSSEVRSHMTRNGASFGQTQAVLAGRETCATCHGPGKSKDVRKVHEISGGGSDGGGDDDDDDKPRTSDRKER